MNHPRTRTLPALALCAVALVAGVAHAEYTLRFSPPVGYSQDFHVEVDGSASGRGKDIEFRGTIELTQTVTAVPEDEMAAIPTELVIGAGSIRYNNRENVPRYIGAPFTASRTRLGVITHVSEPLDDDDDTGIDVTAAVLYATSLLALPERPTRPGREWDGSHDAFDPYGDFVEVSAENKFADLLELPDATLIDVSSKGSFPYSATIDGRKLYGTLEYVLYSKLDLATCTLYESDLTLSGGLKTRGPLAQTINITIHKLHVHATQVKQQIVDVSDRGGDAENDDPAAEDGTDSAWALPTATECALAPRREGDG